jgi:hypothetical protein
MDRRNRRHLPLRGGRIRGDSKHNRDDRVAARVGHTGPLPNKHRLCASFRRSVIGGLLQLDREVRQDGRYRIVGKQRLYACRSFQHFLPISVASHIACYIRHLRAKGSGIADFGCRCQSALFSDFMHGVVDLLHPMQPFLLGQLPWIMELAVDLDAEPAAVLCSSDGTPSDGPFSW